MSEGILIDPFAWGERSETLYYIPPTNKGVRAKASRGQEVSYLGYSDGSPHTQGSIKTPSLALMGGGRYV